MAVTNRDIQAAWHYHYGTMHPSGRLLNSEHHFNPGRQPLLFKPYKELQLILTTT